MKKKEEKMKHSETCYATCSCTLRKCFFCEVEDLDARMAIFESIDAERERQDKKWGEQNHPIVLLPSIDYYINRGIAEGLKSSNRQASREGEITWRGILLEEVYEALAEPDPEKCKSELIQVAAVAVAMIESIQRKQERSHETKSGA